ncbi:hypothetical protein COV18_06370 [Candidatus Woesearchaeota archaeon CG10_big_fil_rev_8_21_14_0_10_37_12]|nr:MAG: hypothetical protein COV18_06370 [Candidatus Woesearchaeota archaeon CG10_big_fil_rev_8_21_14_0_10_37_12]
MGTTNNGEVTVQYILSPDKGETAYKGDVQQLVWYAGLKNGMYQRGWNNQQAPQSAIDRFIKAGAAFELPQPVEISTDQNIYFGRSGVVYVGARVKNKETYPAQDMANPDQITLGKIVGEQMIWVNREELEN